MPLVSSTLRTCMPASWRMLTPGEKHQYDRVGCAGPDCMTHASPSLSCMHIDVQLFYQCILVVSEWKENMPAPGGQSNVRCSIPHRLQFKAQSIL